MSRGGLVNHIELVTVLIGTCEVAYRISKGFFGGQTLNDPLGHKWELLPGFTVGAVEAHIEQFAGIGCFFNHYGPSAEHVTFPHFVPRGQPVDKDGLRCFTFDVYLSLHRVVPGLNTKRPVTYWTRDEALEYLTTLEEEMS